MRFSSSRPKSKKTVRWADCLEEKFEPIEFQNTYKTLEYDRREFNDK